MKLKIVAVAAAAVLSGCASTEVKQEVKKDYSSADQEMAQARAKLAMPEPIVLPVSPTPYFGKTSVAKVALKDELPLPLRSKTLVHFDTPFAYGPEQFANLITEETGVGVRVGKLGAVKTISLSSIPPMTWAELIETAMAQFGLDYDMEGGVLHIDSVFRRLYPFYNTASTTKGAMELGKTSQSTVGAQGGQNTGSSGSFNSKLDVTIANDYDSWKDALNTLKSIAGDKNVVENKGLGFYVTCSKACHKEVADFIDSSNHSNTQQVLFRVLEITVATTSVGQSGVDWNLVYKNLGEGRKYNFTFGTPTNLVQPGAGLIGLNILNPVGGTDRMNGTAAIFSAISTASKIVDVKPYALMAINNEASTLANTDQQTYVQQTTITPTSGTNGQVLFSQIPGYVTYGQLIQVIPKVLPGGRVMVRFGIDDTKLKNLIQATKQGDIDKPLLGGLNFLNKSVIQSGGTLILSGFKRKVSKATDQGLFAKQTMGSEVGDTDYTETVIMMTPVLEGS